MFFFLEWVNMSCIFAQDIHVKPVVCFPLVQQSPVPTPSSMHIIHISNGTDMSIHPGIWMTTSILIRNKKSNPPNHHHKFSRTKIISPVFVVLHSVLCFFVCCFCSKESGCSGHFSAGSFSGRHSWCDLGLLFQWTMHDSCGSLGTADSGSWRWSWEFVA